MERVILHSDANCFYASVEMLYHPEYAGKPLAVGGDPEARHGIVLTANYIAKRSGVKTGMALWQAKQVCPDLIFVPPRMDLYLKFSFMLREIYSEYTNQIEPYGCDEAWLDVTGSSSLKGNGRMIAEEISRRVKKELGITVSIGISWNKIFAKLGSDYKKPDAITEFNKANYQDLIGYFQCQIFYTWEDQRIELYRNMVFAQSENWQEQIQIFWNCSLGKWDLSFIHLRMAGMIRQFQ